MARGYGKRGTSYRKYNTRRRTHSKRRKSSNDLTRLAYKLGQIERGLHNPDSKISESYMRGSMVPKNRSKKALF